MCLIELGVLTNQIVALEKLAKNESSNRIVFDVGGKLSYADNLLTNDEVHVSDMFMEAGSVFPFHKHQDAIEYAIIYKGEIVYIEDSSSRTYKEGEFILIDRHKAHKIVALVDSNIIIITVPSTGEAKKFFGDERK